MKYVRWIGVALLILVMGYLSAVWLFADSGAAAGMVIPILVFLAGCAGIGALTPERWQLAVLGSWGAVIVVMLEIVYRIGKEPIADQQPILQVILIGAGAIGLALLGGYLGSRLRRLK